MTIRLRPCPAPTVIGLQENCPASRRIKRHLLTRPQYRDAFGPLVSDLLPRSTGQGRSDFRRNRRLFRSKPLAALCRSLERPAGLTGPEHGPIQAPQPKSLSQRTSCLRRRRRWLKPCTKPSCERA